MKAHIANWLSNLSVASFVLGMFQAASTTEFFGANTHYAALAFSIGSFIASTLLVMGMEKEQKK